MGENKQENTELQDTELENVTGGRVTGANKRPPINCFCGHSYSRDEASDSRDIKDGCSNITEYQCPCCGKWN